MKLLFSFFVIPTYVSEVIEDSFETQIAKRETP